MKCYQWLNSTDGNKTNDRKSCVLIKFERKIVSSNVLSSNMVT